MQRLNKAELDAFYQAVLTLETAEECRNFFDDICTIQELQAIAQRFAVACRLEEGRSYQQVNRATGASTATICRVSKCLNYGGGGYKTAIDRMKEKKRDT